MVQSSEQSFLTEEDRLIEESKFDKWVSAGTVLSGDFTSRVLVLHDVY